MAGWRSLGMSPSTTRRSTIRLHMPKARAASLGLRRLRRTSARRKQRRSCACAPSADAAQPRPGRTFQSFVLQPYGSMRLSRSENALGRCLIETPFFGPREYAARRPKIKHAASIDRMRCGPSNRRFQGRTNLLPSRAAALSHLRRTTAATARHIPIGDRRRESPNRNRAACSGYHWSSGISSSAS
jgi:hypothetical protein